MSGTYIKNKGITKTVIRKNGKSKVNKINWEADYNGDVANISLDIDDDGTKEHYVTKLTSDDLDHLLNIPSVNEPLEERLANDFLANNQNQVMLEIKNVEPSFAVPDDFRRDYFVVKRRRKTRKRTRRGAKYRIKPTRRHSRRSRS